MYMSHLYINPQCMLEQRSDVFVSAFFLRTSFEVAGTGPAALMTQDVAREAWIDGPSGFGEQPS